MTVKEYAVDVNLTPAEILKKCQELGIEVNDASDVLTDDDIIILDNAIALISTDEDITYEEADEIDDVVDLIIESQNIEKQM